MKFWACLFVLLASPLAVSAAPLAPEDFMLKVAQRLTGQWPMPDDYTLLANAEAQANCHQVSCLDDFFRQYIRQQMQTPAFYAEAILKVFENFGFQTPNGLPFVWGTLFSGTIDSDNREADLIYRVFSQDLPIDELYTSQTVWRQKVDYGNDFFTTVSAFRIDANVQPDAKDFQLQIPGTEKSEAAIEQDFSGHPNISGLFSTPKFEKRYWNTPVNENRKRAAAFFRILFCDSMFPALDRAGQAEREHAQALGAVDTSSVERSFDDIVRNRHASQVDCARCHSVLEPVAHMMRPLELGVGKFSMKGHLVLKDAYGQKTDIPVTNFHDMVVKATQQPRYLDCQMNWMTKWIIGKDAVIHPLRFDEMLSRFDGRGRKVKSTVEDLLMSPEFRNEAPQYAEPPELTKAEAVFSNCYECHSNFLNTHGDGLRAQLGKIAVKLDLAHGGAKPMMPPSDHWWAPSPADIQDVKNWIQQGAPLVQGRSFLSPKEVKTILNPGDAS